MHREIRTCRPVMGATYADTCCAGKHACMIHGGQPGTCVCALGMAAEQRGCDLEEAAKEEGCLTCRMRCSGDLGCCSRMRAASSKVVNFRSLAWVTCFNICHANCMSCVASCAPPAPFPSGTPHLSRSRRETTQKEQKRAAIRLQLRSHACAYLFSLL